MTGAFGPRYIASRVGYAIAGHAAVDAFANDTGPKDAVVLACFGDPGLAALKEIANGAGGRHGRRLDPAGLRLGRSLLHRHRRRALEADAGGVRGRHGLASRLASVRTVAPTGADIARNPKAAMALLAKGCPACVRRTAPTWSSWAAPAWPDLRPS